MIHEYGCLVWILWENESCLVVEHGIWDMLMGHFEEPLMISHGENGPWFDDIDDG